MATGPSFEPAAPYDASTRSYGAGLERQQSMMERSTRLKQNEEMMQMRRQQLVQQQQQDQVMLPLEIAKKQADLANSTMQFRSALNMQQSEAEMAPMVGQAQSEFNQMMTMTDPGAKANAALAFSGKYAQFRNTKKWGAQFEAFDNIAKTLYSENSAITRAQEMERIKSVGPESPVGKMVSDYEKAKASGNTAAAEWILAGIKEQITPKGMGLEVGADGAIKFFQGSGGLTTPNTTKSQERQYQQERLIREGAQLYNIMTPEDLGVQGVIRENLGGILGQIDPTLAEEKVAGTRTKLRNFRESALRLMSDDTRFSNADRQAITTMLPEDGLFENLTQAKAKLRAVTAIMAQRAAGEANRQGGKSWTDLPPDELVKQAREGKIDKDAAGAILDVLHRDWVMQQRKSRDN